MYINDFVNLTSRAWAVPILSHLHEGVAGRQAPLIKATGAGRTAFAQSMDHLIKLGLAERNPGHGHPLRPEFRLTPEGKDVANLAHNIFNVSSDTERRLLRRSWTLPVLTVLYEPRYFGEIRTKLNKVTDRALSQSLAYLESQSWVRREIDAGSRPPRPIYATQNSGAVIADITACAISF